MARPAVLIEKMCLLIVGAVVLGIGVYSHFESAWVKDKLYQICGDLDDDKKQCPDIGYERYVVSIIIICFSLSCIEFVVGLLVNLAGYSKLKLTDVVYHAVAGILLFVAGVLYFISAVDIRGLLDPDGVNNGKFLFPWKIATAALTLLWSALYALVAFKIANIK